MTVKVRFAPSPTGRLHVGNCRTALVNWLFARKNQGVFLLRLDDTDTERNRPEYEQGIYEDLTWLGITFDETDRQSTRMERYREAAEYLKSNGRLYPCYETSEELEFKRRRQMAQGLPPQYDRAALKLTSEQKEAYENEGRKPHWRLKLTGAVVAWQDLVRGEVVFEGHKLSDPVLIREDGTPVYTMASVVDDIDMHITHIVRGEDHVANTAVQIQLAEALGHDPKKFTFAHLPLLADQEGAGLSKRLGSLSVSELRESQILPMAINSILAKLGTSDPIHPYHHMEELIDSFDFSKFSRGTPKFSLDELEHINTKLLHTMSYEEACGYLKSLHKMDAEFWEAVKGNLEKASDLEMWWDICREDHISPCIAQDDKPFLEKALSMLPKEGWNDDPWSVWINTLKASTDRKGKSLFMPLRQALTGQDHGPELKVLVKLMGYKKTRHRLEKAIA
jgi:glutamyl-tRNA synthetase